MSVATAVTNVRDEKQLPDLPGVVSLAEQHFNTFGAPLFYVPMTATVSKSKPFTKSLALDQFDVIKDKMDMGIAFAVDRVQITLCPTAANQTFGAVLSYFAPSGSKLADFLAIPGFKPATTGNAGTLTTTFDLDFKLGTTLVLKPGNLGSAVPILNIYAETLATEFSFSVVVSFRWAGPVRFPTVNLTSD
jgi:hypothetical protein